MKPPDDKQIAIIDTVNSEGYKYILEIITNYLNALKDELEDWNNSREKDIRIKAQIETIRWILGIPDRIK